jgi:hypothetical protein
LFPGGSFLKGHFVTLLKACFFVCVCVLCMNVCEKSVEIGVSEVGPSRVYTLGRLRLHVGSSLDCMCVTLAYTLVCVKIEVFV